MHLFNGPMSEKISFAEFKDLVNLDVSETNTVTLHGVEIRLTQMLVCVQQLRRHHEIGECSVVPGVGDNMLVFRNELDNGKMATIGLKI